MAERPTGADHLTKAIESTIEAYPDKVEAWIEVRPKAWGFLAGKAVIAYRDKIGRALTEAERRVVWHTLWQRLEQIKQSRSARGVEDGQD